jgi:N-methylhydantoinase B
VGNPCERDPALVQEDLRNGLLSPEAARQIYGVEPAPSESSARS